MSTAIVKFKLRRDTADNLSSVVLAEGEPGYATDTHVLKIGDGSVNWNTLHAIGSGGGGGGSLPDGLFDGDYLVWNDTTKTWDTGNVNVHIGAGAGYVGQKLGAVAIGIGAGNSSQGTGAVAIGNAAGNKGQSIGAIAIGDNAGNTSQGQYSIAIGSEAGSPLLSDNTIVLNASGSALTDAEGQMGGFYVSPILSYSGPQASHLMYNPVTSQITYNPSLRKTTLIETIVGGAAIEGTSNYRFTFTGCPIDSNTPATYNFFVHSTTFGACGTFLILQTGDVTFPNTFGTTPLINLTVLEMNVSKCPQVTISENNPLTMKVERLL